eukprot:PhF_6_TR3682/c0_g1_i1/m.5232
MDLAWLASVNYDLGQLAPTDENAKAIRDDLYNMCRSTAPEDLYGPTVEDQLHQLNLKMERRRLELNKAKLDADMDERKREHEKYMKGGWLSTKEEGGIEKALRTAQALEHAGNETWCRHRIVLPSEAFSPNQWEDLRHRHHTEVQTSSSITTTHTLLVNKVVDEAFDTKSHLNKLLIDERMGRNDLTTEWGRWIWSVAKQNGCLVKLCFVVTDEVAGRRHLEDMQACTRISITSMYNH